jgi:hypothetical protein
MDNGAREINAAERRIPMCLRWRTNEAAAALLAGWNFGEVVSRQAQAIAKCDPVKANAGV